MVVQLQKEKEKEKFKSYKIMHSFVCATWINSQILQL